MKDIYNKHPSLLRNANIWNIKILLVYFHSVPDNSELSLKCLTEKITVLLLLIGEQWKQILFYIDIDNVKIQQGKLVTLPNSSLKHTKLTSTSHSVSQVQWEL